MINSITIDDINSLIENSVQENKYLDYKRELHIGTDSEKKEFLADISSFANAFGGDIIIGIEEDNKEKIPTKIIGITYENEDELIRRLEELIRQSIQPIILDIQYQIINVEKHKCILIIRIPQSRIAPHRVEYKGYNKFFYRNNKGKYQMDVNELRLAFNSGIDLNKRIEQYKMDRYYNLIENKYRILEKDKPIFVIHYIPISYFNDLTNRISISQINKVIEKKNWTLFGIHGEKRISVDGVNINYNKHGDSAQSSYLNNGIIEKVTTNYFTKDYIIKGHYPQIKLDYISIYNLFEHIIDEFNNAKEYYRELNIYSPIIISCAFLNAENYTFYEGDFCDIMGNIDRNVLCTNDLYVEDLNEQTEKILKPIFDSIWNACGFKKCSAYDEQGTYIGLR